MALITQITTILAATIYDVLPIAAILLFFQIAVVRRRPPRMTRMLAGFAYVLMGLTLFLIGLEGALFPIGEIMARQLADPVFITGSATAQLHWTDYGWVYLFAGTIGFSTTMAEPALIAIADKASQVSGGAISARGLRIVVAFGVAIGITVGALRIVTGGSLPLLIAIGYVVLVAQTFFANKSLVPLAYDSGGVTTSTVTVPVVTALGLGLAATIPGRNVLIDGFGLIALASLFPMMSVLVYGQATDLRRKAGRRAEQGKTEQEESD